ncbi:MAG: HEPN domain-containing protein [Nitrospiraceae bacterium]
MSRQEIEGLICKARRSIRAANRLLDGEDSDFAVSRAYYGMFYAAQAMLLSRDIRRSKHSGIVAGFQQTFVKSGELPEHFFFRLRDGFDDRTESDYGLAAVTREQAVAGIQAADEFVEEMARHLEVGH